MIRRIRERLAADDGFGLAELGVYAVLSVIVLGIVGSVLITSIKTRIQVVEMTEAVGVGQLIANSVEEGVRNASGPPGAIDAQQRVGIQAGVVTADGQLLRARVAIGAIEGTVVWQCQAWFYSSTTEAVYAATNKTTSIADPVSFSVVNGIHTAQQGSDQWILLGEGVQIADAEHPLIFGSKSAGTGDQKAIILYFKVARSGTQLVFIPTTVVNRKLEAGGTGPTTCY